MKRNVVRRGIGALLVITVLGIRGLAAAEPAGPVWEIGPAFFWDLLAGVFLADQTPLPENPGGGGEGSHGGGAMDPNGGGPKPTPPPPPPVPQP